MVADQSRNPVLAVFPEGEASKNLDRFRELLGQMLKHSFTRSDCVVAVGGGVVGDVAGFAAACYMRGIDFYNVPTTLLAQVDSSIGGKTAVDLDGVKNAVGAFHQPKGVAVDPEVLRTLSERQLHAGLAEAIKMAATSDEDLFARIEASSSLENDLESIICSALQIKQSVVEQDPEEHGLRRVLNFGHTIGHAIESAEGGMLLHGECVAAGMIPMCGEDCRERLRNVLKKYDLPTGTSRSREELLPYLIHDKKQESDRIRVVCVDRIGSFWFDSMTPEQILDRMEY
jgi:3-dehydroquinate synthase